MISWICGVIILGMMKIDFGNITETYKKLYEIYLDAYTVFERHKEQIKRDIKGESLSTWKENKFIDECNQIFGKNANLEQLTFSFYEQGEIMTEILEMIVNSSLSNCYITERDYNIIISASNNLMANNTQEPLRSFLIDLLIDQLKENKNV